MDQSSSLRQRLLLFLACFMASLALGLFFQSYTQGQKLSEFLGGIIEQYQGDAIVEFEGPRISLSRNGWPELGLNFDTLSINKKNTTVLCHRVLFPVDLSSLFSEKKYIRSVEARDCYLSHGDWPFGVEFLYLTAKLNREGKIRTLSTQLRPMRSGPIPTTPLALFVSGEYPEYNAKLKWRESNSVIDFNWTNFEATGAIRDLPLRELFATLKHVNVVQHQIDQASWVNSEFEISGDGKKHWDIQIRQLETRGDIGMLQINNLGFQTSPLKISPFKIKFENAALGPIAEILGQSWLKTTVGNSGLLFGTAEGQSLTDIQSAGEIKNLELTFSRRGRKAIQIVEQLQWELKRNELGTHLALENWKLVNGELNGGIDVKLERLGNDVNGKFRIPSFQPNSDVQNLFYTQSGDPFHLTGSLKMSNNQLTYVQAKLTSSKRYLKIGEIKKFFLAAEYKDTQLSLEFGADQLALNKSTVDSFRSWLSLPANTNTYTLQQLYGQAKNSETGINIERLRFTGAPHLRSGLLTGIVQDEIISGSIKVRQSQPLQEKIYQVEGPWHSPQIR